ncbi:MAG: TonB-dependent receptor [Pseudomonadota bacterium]
MIKKAMLACFLVANSMPSFAEEISAETEVVSENKIEADSTLVLGNVDVSANQSGAFSTRSVLSSVDILGADRIQNQNVLNSWELFGQMPGIQFTQFRQGVESGKVSFRGFNGEGEINAIKLLIDGVPSNTNDGNMRYMDMIFPLEIEALEVVRGTNDPRYGLHNIAGNINMVTKQGGNYWESRASYGSFDTKELQTAVGIENNGFAQNYFVAAQETDGYRDHAHSDKYSLAGKWFFTPENEKFKLGLVARHYEHDANEPGYLTIAQARDDDRQSRPHNATDGGERLMNQVSGNFDWSITDNLSLSSKAYYNKYDDTRWVRFAITAPQQERATNESHQGFLASMTWRPTVDFLQDFALEGGLNKEWQENESRRFTTLNRARTAITRDQNFDFDMTGGYVQAIIKPTEKLKIIPAYRIDYADGFYVNNLNGRRFEVNDYGQIRQPKLSVMYNLNDAYTAYGNWGRTFQVGVGTAAYKVNQTEDLEPSINEGWELGIKFKPTNWLDGRIAGWAQRAKNEARRKLNDSANDSENIGKTLRQGIDFQINARPTEKLDVWFAYSWQDSEILKADAASILTVGQEIDHVPHYLVSSGFDFRATPDWRFGMIARAQGNAYIERENTKGKFGQFLLFDASANYKINGKVNVDFQVRNLTNRSYEYVFMNAEPMVAPGDGRAGYIAVNLKL